MHCTHSDSSFELCFEMLTAAKEMTLGTQGGAVKAEVLGVTTLQHVNGKRRQFIVYKIFICASFIVLPLLLFLSFVLVHIVAA